MSRLAYWKQRDLDERDLRTIQRIEEHGCSIIQVKRASDSPPWAYSIGLFENFKSPEVVVMGLPEDVSLSVIGDLADKARGGVKCVDGKRLTGLLAGDFECELREVRPQWYPHLLNWANWFYGSTEYPALQCIWPDLDYRMPWEDGFNPDWLYDQPLLYREKAQEARMDRLIDALENSDGKCSCSEVRENWPFSEDPHFATLSQTHVTSGEYPVLLVTHDKEDGTWQMLDGSPDPQAPTIVCLHHLVDRDPTLAEIADLPLGWRAWRDAVGSEWHREVRPPRDDED